MKKALVVGGANGVGMSIATQLAKCENYEKIYIIDKVVVSGEFANPKFESIQFDLTSEDFSVFDGFRDIDTLMITAGFGKLSLFKDIAEISVIIIAHHFTDFINLISILQQLLRLFYAKVRQIFHIRCANLCFKKNT